MAGLDPAISATAVEHPAPTPIPWGPLLGLTGQISLLRLSLTDFRSYASLVWSPRARISVLFGPNGSGKTNLLEAVSLLSPGRGLRGARNQDFARRGAGATGQWAVAARMATPEGTAEIGTGTPPGGPPDRRVFRLDGTTPRTQTEIARRVAMVWLTPQMERLFQEAPAGRRRFLDRLVWALEPGHARQVASHDSAVSGRNRLLAEGRRDPSWLAGLEDAIARHAVAVTAARVALVRKLDAFLSGPGVPGFPPVRVTLNCPISTRLETAPAIEVEDWLRTEFVRTRDHDASIGSASVGAHRGDLALSDAAHGLPASLASSGEQKSMLVGLILAHAALIAEARGFAPLLLLDEPAVHLDPARREALFAEIVRLPAQVLITGTDAETFLPLAGIAEPLQTGDGRLVPASSFRSD
jgi:DNA replication and repair protein RecF